MRGLGQIAALAAFARPHVGVITTIGPVHLELARHGRARRPGEGGAARGAPAGGTRRRAREPLLEPYLRATTSTVVRRSATATLTLESCEAAAPSRRRWATVELDVRSPRATRRTNALAALHAYDALGLPLDARTRRRGRVLRAGAARSSPLPGGGLLINDA